MITEPNRDISAADPDPRGLIREAYRIEGITPASCRTIFLDWAMGQPVDADVTKLIGTVLGLYGPDHPDHPMTAVLQEGLGSADAPRRRGGSRARAAER